MVNHIIKSHNKTLLIYHVVTPVKYRRDIFTPTVSQTLKQTCIEFGKHYEIHFLEIGLDNNHTHFLIQTVPNTTLSNVVKKIKSITARELFNKHPEIKKRLWGGNLWTSDYYANTVGQYGNLDILKNYVQTKEQKTTLNSTKTNQRCLKDWRKLLTSYSACLHRGWLIPYNFGF